MILFCILISEGSVWRVATFFVTFKDFWGSYLCFKAIKINMLLFFFIFKFNITFFFDRFQIIQLQFVFILPTNLPCKIKVQYFWLLSMLYTFLRYHKLWYRFFFSTNVFSIFFIFILIKSKVILIVIFN